ncbi:tetratricopeptide repeat protein [Thorsellia anophelis]|uniref:Regulator of sirC expression, contains transglutaminase-like and TPR domains n=1 Tax=Thorsellia anophelis DSM 18579 TaxID=1123402 RepID=A0A1I0EU13_9GAMM|nr:tetratricopeptide repeat protein [Thorsellia anophelis]SET49059.1 Regulator of sirC expression, contains transglutaminase-like and TPR domains [Thorsellia anophelis DSM 18579]
MFKFTEEFLNESTLIDSFIQIEQTYRNTNFNKASLKRTLNAITSKALSSIDTYTQDELAIISNLNEFFYVDLGFKGPQTEQENFNELYYIDKVLKNRRGCDLILAVIYCHIATELNLKAYPIFYIGQVIIRIDMNHSEKIFLNAETGEVIPLRNLKLYANHTGSNIRFTTAMLDPQPNCHTALLLAAMRKSCYIEIDRLDDALNMSNLILTVYPEEAFERRERGMILAKLGCPHIAVQELQYFVESCPNDPLAEITKAQISVIMPEPIAIH